MREVAELANRGRRSVTFISTARACRMPVESTSHLSCLAAVGNCQVAERSNWPMGRGARRMQAVSGCYIGSGLFERFAPDGMLPWIVSVFGSPYWRHSFNTLRIASTAAHYSAFRSALSRRTTFHSAPCPCLSPVLSILPPPSPRLPDAVSLLQTAFLPPAPSAQRYRLY